MRRIIIIKIIFSLTLLLIIGICFSCKSPTGPVELQPGRRDYTWTVDTLNIPYTVLESIWGSSPSDVWCVGPGGDKDKTIYHFNGQKWVNDGISRPLSPTAVFGFSASNVWFGSYGNTIWHYDGNNISRFQDYTIPNYSYAGIENIWGDSPNNVYALGFADSSNVLRGVIQHFDGSKWETVYMSTKNEDFVRIYKGIFSGNNYYILSSRNNDNNNIDSTIIYQFNGKSLKEISSLDFFARHSSNLAFIASEVYFVLDNGVYLYDDNLLSNNNGFRLLFNVDNQNFDRNICGRNRDDIFLCMKDGIAHYNGTDIQYLYHFHSNIYISGTPAIFDEEIFFLAYDFQNNINLIIRGKLN
ncbi:MAG: hypothetical protein ACYCVH_10315 [Ignavibacteriaceae bacterium]